jgi:hypothetical protein
VFCSCRWPVRCTYDFTIIGEKPSSNCSAIVSREVQQLSVSSLMLVFDHWVMILVPFLMKVLTFFCRASLSCRNSMLELNSGEVVSLHLMQRLRGVLLSL